MKSGQRTLLYWTGIIGSPDHIATFASTIEKLQQGQYNAADLDQKYRLNYNNNFYPILSARGNDTHRLLLTEWEYEGKNYLFIFDVALNHHYPDPIHTKLIKYINDPTKVTKKIKNKKFIFQSAASNDSNNNNESMPQPIIKRHRYFNQKFITLSDQQEKILHSQLPLIFIGAPGAGKSTTCMAAIEDYSQKQSMENTPCHIVYLCNSENLAKEMLKNIKLVDEQQTIECLSIQTLIERHKPNDFFIMDKATAKDDFKSWFSIYKKLDNIDANSLYEEFLTISGCDNETDYLQMGERETHLQHDKKALFSAYQSYVQHLKQIKKINTDFFEMPDNAQYDFVIYDEAQNASPMQIKSAIQLITPKNENEQQQQQNNIIFCFGTHQNLSSRNTAINVIKKSFFANGIEVEQVVLNHCHRSSKKVINFTNQLLRVFSSVGASYKEEGNFIELADSNTEEGHVSWIDKSDIPSLLQLAKSIKFAIVTHEKLIAEAKNIFDTENVYTPEQIQGLEYPYILAYKLFQVDEKSAIDEIKEISDNLTDASLPSKEMRRPKNKEMPKLIATFLRQTVVACSRAMNSLYLYDTPMYYNEKIISKLSSSTDKCNLSKSEAIAPSTKEEWQLHRQVVNEKLGLQPAESTIAPKTIEELKKLIDSYETNNKEINQILRQKNELTENESIKIINYLISNSSDSQLSILTKKKWSIRNSDIIFSIFYKMLFLKKIDTHKALFAMIVSQESFNENSVGHYFQPVKNEITAVLKKLIVQNATQTNLSIFIKIMDISSTSSLFTTKELINLFFSNKDLKQDYGLALFDIIKNQPLPDDFIEECLDKLKKSNHCRLIHSIIYTSPNFDHHSPVRKILIFISHALNDKKNISFDRDFRYEEFKSLLISAISNQISLNIRPLINKEADFKENTDTLMKLLFTLEAGGRELLVPDKKLNLTEIIDKAWKKSEIFRNVGMNPATTSKKLEEENNNNLNNIESCQLIRKTLFKLISKNDFLGATDLVKNEIIKNNLDAKKIFLTPILSSFDDNPFDTHEGKNTLFSLMYTQLRNPVQHYNGNDFCQFMSLFGDKSNIPFSDFFPPNTQVTEQLLGIYEFNVYVTTLNFISHQFGKLDPFLIAMGVYFERTYNVPFDWINITHFTEQLKNHTMDYLNDEIKKLEAKSFPIIETMKLAVLIHINKPDTLQAALLNTTNIADWSAIINEYWYDDAYLDNLIETFKSKIKTLPDYLNKILFSFIMHLRSIDAEILYIFTDSMRQNLYSASDLTSIFRFTGGHLYFYPKKCLISDFSNESSKLIESIMSEKFSLDEILSSSNKKNFITLTHYFKELAISQNHDNKHQVYLNNIINFTEISYLNFTTILRLSINEAMTIIENNSSNNFAKYLNIGHLDIFSFFMKTFSRLETITFRIFCYLFITLKPSEKTPFLAIELIKNAYIDPNSTLGIRMQTIHGEVISKEPVLANFLRSKAPTNYFHVLLQHAYLDINTPYPLHHMSAIQTPLVALCLTASASYARKAFVLNDYPISSVLNSAYRPICYLEINQGVKPTLNNIIFFISNRPLIGKFILAQFIFYSLYVMPNALDRNDHLKKTYFYHSLAILFTIYSQSNSFLAEISLPVHIDDYMVLCSDLKLQLEICYPDNNVKDLIISQQLASIIKLFVMLFFAKNETDKLLKNIKPNEFSNTIEGAYLKFSVENESTVQTTVVHPIAKKVLFQAIERLKIKSTSSMRHIDIPDDIISILSAKIFDYYKDNTLSRIKLESFLFKSNEFYSFISRQYLAFLRWSILTAAKAPEDIKNNFFILIFNIVMLALEKNNISFDLIACSFIFLDSDNKSHLLPLISFLNEHKFDVSTAEKAIACYCEKSITYRNQSNEAGLKVNMIILFLLFTQSHKPDSFFVNSYYLRYAFKPIFELLVESMGLEDENKKIDIKNTLFRNFLTFIKFVIYNMFEKKDTRGTQLDKFEVNDKWFSDFNEKYCNYNFKPFASDHYQNPHFMKALVAMAKELKNWETNTTRFQPKNSLLVNQGFFSTTPPNDNPDARNPHPASPK